MAILDNDGPTPQQRMADGFADSMALGAIENAVIRLCYLLNQKGAITGAEVAAIRHLHLHDFDFVQAAAKMPRAFAQAVEDRRARAEELWDHLQWPST